MAVVCPTVTAADAHSYRQQIEKLEKFAERVHLDFADGSLTDNKLFSIEHAWSPAIFRVDVHLMSQNPETYLQAALRLNPRLIIVHVDAEVNLGVVASLLHPKGVRLGVALLPDQSVNSLETHKSLIDHVLIFSGKLGHFGGVADLSLLDKVAKVKRALPLAEVSWDGGINAEVASSLVEGGVDVLNVGGFIQGSEDPAGAYAKLKQVINERA